MKDRRKVEERFESYESLMEEIKYLAEKYRHETQDKLRSIIEDVVAKQTLSNTRLVDIEKNLARHNKFENKLKHLDGQIKECVKNSYN